MTASGEALRAVGDLASSQWGMFTSAQARAAGLTVQHLARLADTGVINRVRHGVYRSAGTPHRPHDDLRAAWLVLAPDRTAGERLRDADVEVVSHRSAVALHDLGDLDADDLEFTTGRRKQSRDPQVRFHRRSISAADWTLLDGLPVTTVLTTIRDLADAHVDGGHLAGVVRDAVTTQHLDVDQVATVLQPYAHQYGLGLGQGSAMLRDLLEQAGVPADTQAVSRLLEPMTLVEQVEAAITPVLVEFLTRQPRSSPALEWLVAQRAAAARGALSAGAEVDVTRSPVRSSRRGKT